MRRVQAERGLSDARHAVDYIDRGESLRQIPLDRLQQGAEFRVAAGEVGGIAIEHIDRLRPRRRGGRLLLAQFGVAVQHALLEPAQFTARVEAEIAQTFAGPAVNVEGFCLSPGAVQRRHQQSYRRLVRRAARYELGQLADDLVVQAEPQLDLDALEDDGAAPLL